MAETVSTKTMEELANEILHEKIMQPTAPVNIAIREASILQRYASEDKEALVARGLDPEKITELGARGDFLQDKQTAWIREFETSVSNTEEWDAMEEEASLLQRELKYDFQFALRNNEKALRKLKIITEGRGQADLAQDLSNYSGIAKDFPNELTAINFDKEKLRRADTLSHKLNLLLRKINGAQISAKRPEKEMRDRAYTYLKQLVDEIRDYGKYTFWNDAGRQKLYSSEYGRKKHAKSNKKTEKDMLL